MKNLENTENGQALVNVTSFKKEKNKKTSSVGFCFLNIDDYTPEYAMHFLSGIVNFDICAIFDVDVKKLKKSEGGYAKPIKETGNYIEDLLNFLQRYEDNFIATEYCTNTYNNKDFKLIKYSENVWKQRKPYGKQTELEWNYEQK